MAAEPRAREAGAATEDAILGGRLKLRQPAAGYRIGIDPIFLAAAAPALGQGRALELGAGVGAAALCLAWRQPQASILGLELQPDLAALAAENTLINGLSPRLRFLAGDLLNPPGEVAGGSFDLVMANPPFHAAGSVTPPADLGRARGHLEGEAGLAAWIARGLSLAGPAGALLLIHRPERLGEILGHFEGRAGGVVVFPLWPAARAPARRILVLARKGSRAPATLAAGLVLHGPGGGYSAAAEAVLRNGEPIQLG